MISTPGLEDGRRGRAWAKGSKKCSARNWERQERVALPTPSFQPSETDWMFHLQNWKQINVCCFYLELETTLSLW